jgi:hypothetical protein
MVVKETELVVVSEQDRTADSAPRLCCFFEVGACEKDLCPPFGKGSPQELELPSERGLFLQRITACEEYGTLGDRILTCRFHYYAGSLYVNLNRKAPRLMNRSYPEKNLFTPRIVPHRTRILRSMLIFPLTVRIGIKSEP